MGRGSSGFTAVNGVWDGVWLCRTRGFTLLATAWVTDEWRWVMGAFDKRVLN